MGRCYLSNSGFCMVILLLGSSCFGVGANQMAAAALGGYRSLDAIGQARAGTNQLRLVPWRRLKTRQTRWPAAESCLESAHDTTSMFQHSYGLHTAHDFVSNLASLLATSKASLRSLKGPCHLPLRPESSI